MANLFHQDDLTTVLSEPESLYFLICMIHKKLHKKIATTWSNQSVGLIYLFLHLMKPKPNWLQLNLTTTAPIFSQGGCLTILFLFDAAKSITATARLPSVPLDVYGCCPNRFSGPLVISSSSTVAALIFSNHSCCAPPCLPSCCCFHFLQVTDVLQLFKQCCTLSLEICLSSTVYKMIWLRSHAILLN